MPELPEVETVVRGLTRSIKGKTIARVILNNPHPKTITVSKKVKGKDFCRLLANRQITRIDRRGKNILIRLSNDSTLWVHLKMTGHFFEVEKKQPLDKHDLVVFEFYEKNNPGGRRKKSSLQLRFSDYRRFGRLRLFPDEELWQQDGLKNIGSEPLKLSSNDFVALCKQSHRQIKAALLDQSFLAGLGNIYADETLHLARIHPRRITSSVSNKKLVALHGHIQWILLQAIKKMGTSVDSYSSLDGRPGRYQKYLKVYGQEGQPCQFCDRKIIREKIGSRSAHYCPRCQKL